MANAPSDAIGGVVLLEDLRGVTLPQIDEILARPPMHMQSPSEAHSPDRSSSLPAPQRFDCAPAENDDRDEDEDSRPIDLPSTASLAVMRRALKMVEAQAAAGCMIDPQQAWHQAFECEAAPSEAEPVMQVVQPVASKPPMLDAGVGDDVGLPLGTTQPLQEDEVEEVRPHAACSGSRAARSRRWFVQRLPSWHGPSAAPSPRLANEMAIQSEEECRPLASCDGNAPEGESDWAYALRWSRPDNASTVYAQMIAAEAEGTAAAAHSPGVDGSTGPRRAATLSSFSDASALAAAARRAATAFRRAPPEGATAEPAASGSAASVAATTMRKSASRPASQNSQPASAVSAGSHVTGDVDVGTKSAHPATLTVGRHAKRGSHRRSAST